MSMYLCIVFRELPSLKKDCVVIITPINKLDTANVIRHPFQGLMFADLSRPIRHQSHGFILTCVVDEFQLTTSVTVPQESNSESNSRKVDYLRYDSKINCKDFPDKGCLIDIGRDYVV